MIFEFTGHEFAEKFVRGKNSAEKRVQYCQGAETLRLASNEFRVCLDFASCFLRKNTLQLLSFAG